MASAGARRPGADQGDETPRRSVTPVDFVPRRPAVSRRLEADTPEGFWTSHQFWKGIVVGAAVVLLIKMVLAVQMPYGIDWYG